MQWKLGFGYRFRIFSLIGETFDMLVNGDWSIICVFELCSNLYLNNFINLFLFLYAGMILTDKRESLTPEFFEDLIILHMNEW